MQNNPTLEIISGSCPTCGHNSGNLPKYDASSNTLYLRKEDLVPVPADGATFKSHSGTGEGLTGYCLSGPWYSSDVLMTVKLPSKIPSIICVKRDTYRSLTTE